VVSLHQVRAAGHEHFAHDRLAARDAASKADFQQRALVSTEFLDRKGSPKKRSYTTEGAQGTEKIVVAWMQLSQNAAVLV
jgi:hypothetical protein